MPTPTTITGLLYEWPGLVRLCAWLLAVLVAYTAFYLIGAALACAKTSDEDFKDSLRAGWNKVRIWRGGKDA